MVNDNKLFFYTSGGDSSYLQLPSGLLLQELPPAYFRERDWYARRSSSPSDSGVMSPESWHDDLDRYGDRGQNESGIGSGVDSGKAKSPPVPGSGSGGATGMGHGPGSSSAGKQVGSERQFSTMDSKLQLSNL